MKCWLAWSVSTRSSTCLASYKKCEWVQVVLELCEFDSHTTTIKINVQLLKYKVMMIKSKITGRDISKEFSALLSGLITNDEFELITLTIK